MSKRAWRRLFLQVNLGFLCFFFLLLWGAFLSRLLFGERVCLCVRWLHLYCPGCGGTRALLCLLRGEFLLAVRLFWPLAVLLPVALYYEVISLAGCVCRSFALPRPALWPLWVAVGSFAVFFVVRNLLFYLTDYDPLGELSKITAAFVLW